MIKPKKLASMGRLLMCEAILDLLYEKYSKDVGVGAAEIGKRLGIYRKAGVVHMNDAIVTGFLNELHELGKVIQKPQPNGKGGWSLSHKEYNSRKREREG